MDKLKHLFFSVVLLAVAVFLFITGIRDFRASKRIAASGKSTTGKVEDTRESRGRRGSRSYYVTASFQTDSKQQVRQEVKVDRDTFRQAAATGVVPVHYAASNPETCAFGEKVKSRYANFIWGALALIGSGILGAGIFQSHESESAPVTIDSIPAKPSTGPEQASVNTCNAHNSLEEAA